MPKKEQAILDLEADVLEKVAGFFEGDAKQAPDGAAFHGGPLDGASIYNVNMRTARKLRELAKVWRRGEIR